MNKISSFDRNMAVCTRLTDADIVWHDVHMPPFSLHGFYGELEPNEPFRRMPAEVADTVNPGVSALALNTAGGRVRFSTTSPYIAIHAEMEDVCHLDNLTAIGTFGFDLYQFLQGQEVYSGTFRPPFDLRGGFESKLFLPGDGKKEITIHFPLYNNVDRLLIGVREGSTLDFPREYTLKKPVVYYGSSITQGGCASRPGNCYTAMISRLLDCDHINLGFSGSALGEQSMANYIAGLDMSLFVFDYDHNAPNAAHLYQTHLPFYRTIRRQQPTLPILIISRPDHGGEQEILERRAAILETYQTAINAGDQHIAFMDGTTLFQGEQYSDCTVDGVHPNDLGFFRMAQQIAPQIRQILLKSTNCPLR